MMQVIIDGININVSNLTIRQFLELIELNKDKEIDFIRKVIGWII